MNGNRRILRSGGSSGFTLIETLVVLCLAGVLAAIGAAELYRQIPRRKLVSTAQQTSMLLRLARLEAIKQSSAAVVRPQLDPVFNRHLVILSFADTDQDGQWDAGEPQLGYLELPKSISVSEVVDLTPPNPPGPYNQAVFKSDGSIQKEGAFRFRNERGEELEVRVPLPSGVKVVLRKKDSGGDFREQGEGGVSWSWK